MHPRTLLLRPCRMSHSSNLAMLFAVSCLSLHVTGCAVASEENDNVGADADELRQRKNEELAWARAHDNHCLRQHLSEALDANRDRRETYARLSNGRSERVSSVMIGMDRVGLGFADMLDGAGENVRGRRGVNIVCELVPSMAAAPALPQAAGPALRTPYEALPLPKMRRALRALAKAHDWDGLAREASRYAEATGEQTQQHCFTRQAFRTLARLGQVIPEHGTAEAEAFGEKAVNIMLPMTRGSALVDKMAAETQSQGVPILCADMPRVPTF